MIYWFSVTLDVLLLLVVFAVQRQYTLKDRELKANLKAKRIGSAERKNSFLRANDNSWIENNPYENDSVAGIAINEAVDDLGARGIVDGVGAVTHAVTNQVGNTLNRLAPMSPSLFNSPTSPRALTVINSPLAVNSPGTDGPFSKLHNNEKQLMHVMQALILVMSYTVARFIGNPTSWNLEEFDKYHALPAHWCFIFCISFMLTLVLLVPELVVEFNVMMRVPPFVDAEEAHTIQLIHVSDPDCMGRTGVPDSKEQDLSKATQLNNKAKELMLMADPQIQRLLADRGVFVDHGTNPMTPVSGAGAGDSAGSENGARGNQVMPFAPGAKARSGGAQIQGPPTPVSVVNEQAERTEPEPTDGEKRGSMGGPAMAEIG
jgi:hypothetical protein